MVVLTHLHRDHVGWNLRAEGARHVPTFPRARYWMSAKDWEVCHQPEVQPQRFPNAPHLCLAPGRAGPGRADAGRAQPDAGSDGGAHPRSHPGAHEHPDHLGAGSGRSSSATLPTTRCRSRSPVGVAGGHGPRPDPSDPARPDGSAGARGDPRGRRTLPGPGLRASPAPGGPPLLARTVASRRVSLADGSLSAEGPGRRRSPRERANGRGVRQGPRAPCAQSDDRVASAGASKVPRR